MINFKKKYLCTVIPMLLSGAGMVHAQAADAVDAAAMDSIEEVVITGIRSSIKHAQDYKRDATGVVDAITSEDLGKFTDDNIGAAIARVPGVQIQRNDNGIGGDRVSIRGMGPLFVNTTVNGRTPLSHGDEGIGNIRQFNLDVIPAEIVSGVVVRKMPTAETIEGGIGGSVELQTIKPLDADVLYQHHDNFGGAVTVSSVNDSLTEEWSPKFSGVFGFRNDANTLAGYVAAVLSDADYSVDEAYTRAQARDIQIDTTGDGLADRVEEGVISHSRITLNAIRGSKERQSFSAGLEWQATEDWKFGVDGYNSVYNVYSQRPTVDLFFDYSGVFDEDAISIENNFVQSVDGSGVTGASFGVDNFDLLFDNLSQNSVFGLNAVYGEDTDFTVSGDVSYSSVDFEQDLRLGITTAIGLDSSQFRFDGTGDVPSFTYDDAINDVDTYTSVGFFGRDRRGTNEQLAFKLDAEWKLDDGISLKAGVRQASTEIDVRETGRFTLIWADPALEAASFPGGFTDKLFPGSGINFDQFLQVDYDAQAAVYPEIFNERASSATINDPLLSVVDGDGLPLDRANSFLIEEDTLAFYVQADLVGEVGNRGFTANAGIRTVATDRTASGFQSTRVVNSLNAVVEDLGFLPVKTDSDDFQVLPSANFMLEVTENLQWRIGVAKTMSQPEYTDLKVNGAVNLKASSAQDPNYDPSTNPTAEIGNPRLNPYTAWSFDTTVEYYTENGGAIFASYFYKDVTDFVLREARSNVSIDGYSELFDTTQPINVAKGLVQGLELGTNIPLGDFGIQANYTFVDSEFDNPDNNPLLNNGFPGASKHNFNAIGYYEIDKFAARLAYIYRDDYFQALGGGFDRANQPAFGEGSSQVDINLTYDVMEQVEVSLNIINATEEDSRNYINEDTNFRDYVTRPRTMVLGLRASF